jgi:hypothetical protein
MAENPALRVSDADREQICARLREAYAEGRLTAEEFHQRTDRALAARTGADLAPLTADLPAPAPLPLPANQLPQRRELRRIWTAWASMAILLNAVWILTAITSSDLPAYWPVWPLGITGALAVVALSMFETRTPTAWCRPPMPPGQGVTAMIGAVRADRRRGTRSSEVDHVKSARPPDERSAHHSSGGGTVFT